MNDFENQGHFVSESIERILQQIDRDPLSPSYGCAHLAYWRDKTSDVADTRRQEVMLPLTLLYKQKYPFSNWSGNERLKAAITSLLSYWCHSQYSDGSFDEWYKGERAFAAAAFSSHAVARTLWILQDELQDEIRKDAKKKLTKTANWLIKHNDLFKTNHQAVGVGALAWVGKVINDENITREAYKKLGSIIKVQHTEGWFPEIGSMDVGYTFLTVEFITMFMDLLNDWSNVEPFIKAFDFACEFIHPDLTIGEEYGSCHNPYLSRIAIVLLSPYSRNAAYLRKQFEDNNIGFKGFQSVLADDLRLFRWAYQPLLAYDYHQSIKYESHNISFYPIPLKNTKSKNKIFIEEGIACLKLLESTILIVAKAGGLVRFIGENGKVFSEHGYAIKIDDKYATNLTYNPNIAIEEVSDVIKVTVPISIVRKFFPSFLSRVLLRIACTTSFGSIITRKIIDFIRKKQGTAVNQSSYNLSASSKWFLYRTISIEKDIIIINDKLDFDSSIKAKTIYFVQSYNHESMILKSIMDYLPDNSVEVKQLTVTRSFSPPFWHITEISSNNGQGE